MGSNSRGLCPNRPCAHAANRRSQALTGRAHGASGSLRLKTTQAYIDLAGETFRAEAELLEQRLFGANAQIPAARL
jgi:hypothetical protein